jgi:enoyl-CoA hydratase/carnithine racemase
MREAQDAHVMTDTLAITQPADGVALLTLNRPHVMNAIDMALFEALMEAFGAFEFDAKIRSVVIAGAGERAFSAGFDIHEMVGFDAAAMAAAFTKRDRLFWRIADYAKPIVAALNGVAYGAGALIAAAADLRLASASLQFKVTASSYGAANATWSLPPILGIAKAKEILFTGRVVGAEEALEIGLVNQVVKDHSVLDAAVEMAAAIAANPAEGVQGIKSLVNRGVGRSLEDAYDAEFTWVLDHMTTDSGGEQVFEKFLSKKPSRST